MRAIVTAARALACAAVLFSLHPASTSAKTLPLDPGFIAERTYSAHLSGHRAPDTVIVERRCAGGTCTRKGLVYVLQPAAHHFTRADDGNALGALGMAIPGGTLIHLAPHADAIRSAIASPFTCTTCTPNVPVLIVVTHGALTDSLYEHPALLRADAAAAWARVERLRRAGALQGLFTVARVHAYAQMFRYLADMCRLGHCSAGWQKIFSVYTGKGTQPTLERMHRGLVFDGFYR